MSKFYRNMTALAALMCAWPLAATAQSATNWLTNEENKIQQDASLGTINAGQAASLQQRAGMIQSQEQRDLIKNGGTLTPQENRHFGNELRDLNHGINRDAYRDANPYARPNGWQQGLNPWQNGMAPAPNGFAPVQNGFVPTQNGFVPTQNGFVTPNGALPGQYRPQFNNNWQNANGTANPNWNNGQQGQPGQHHHHHHDGQWNPNNTGAGINNGGSLFNSFNHQ